MVSGLWSLGFWSLLEGLASRCEPWLQCTQQQKATAYSSCLQGSGGYILTPLNKDAAPGALADVLVKADTSCVSPEGGATPADGAVNRSGEQGEEDKGERELHIRGEQSRGHSGEIVEARYLGKGEGELCNLLSYGHLATIWARLHYQLYLTSD